MKKITAEKFKTLTDKEKRILTAKDALDQIRLNKLIIKTGSYVTLPDREELHDVYKEGTELQEILQESPCEVCAKGALLCANVALVDNFKIEGNPSLKFDAKIKQQLDFFSNDQLDLIEAAFEGWLVHDENSLDEDEISAAISFYHNYDHAEDRLIAILENIIDNEGTFIP